MLNHGISWRPSRDYLVNMPTETVSLARRGVWHVFWEFIQKQRCTAPNPQPLKIGNLFAFNPETGIEYEKALPGKIKLIELINPDVLADFDKNEIWIKFSVMRSALNELKISRPKLLMSITNGVTTYRQ